VTFGSGGKLVVAGGGLFSITGNLDLGTFDERWKCSHKPTAFLTATTSSRPTPARGRARLMLSPRESP
jgi:hypothetical protein